MTEYERIIYKTWDYSITKYTEFTINEFIPLKKVSLNIEQTGHVMIELNSSLHVLQIFEKLDFFYNGISNLS